MFLIHGPLLILYYTHVDFHIILSHVVRKTNSQPNICISACLTGSTIHKLSSVVMANSYLYVSLSAPSSQMYSGHINKLYKQHVCSFIEGKI